MNKLNWKTEEEMQKELKERLESRKEGESRDGYVLSAEGKFNYRGIFYLIKVLRYFNHTNNFTTISERRISDSHAVVEYPDETKPLVDLVGGIEGVYDFLYHDTLHLFNDKQTIEKQIEVCYKWAKEDIDNLLDGKISETLDEGIKKLQEVKDKLNEGIKDLK